MNIEKMIELYKKELMAAFNSVSVKNIVKFVEMIFTAYEKERTIFVCGNGGSVSYAQNFVVDLNMHPFVSDDKGMQLIPRNKFKCVNLCSDQATITGISNDLGFRFIFSEQLKFQGEKGDLIFGISGSGNSKNILEAFRVAKDKEMKIILMTRNKVNSCGQFADLTLCLQGTSIFPGQTGGNNYNFSLEDLVSSFTHIAVGLLKEKVQNENKSK